MDDDGDKKHEDQAVEPVETAPRDGDAEDRPGRKEGMPHEELLRILKAHRTWVETNNLKGTQADFRQANLIDANLIGANLQEADFGGANLQGVNLVEANLQGATLALANLEGAVLDGAQLQGANLYSTNLQGARLPRANLQGARLIEANLQWADLSKATFEGLKKNGGRDPTDEWEAADLTDADLRNADLSDAKLSRVTGLLADKLAGVNLSNAKLPPDIAKFEILGQLTEISKHARNNFLAVLGACAFSWLTIGTTTDVALLINRAETALPIVGAKVPIASFYWVAPPILLAFFVYLHLYLQRMWSALATLPAFFPEGHSLDRRAYPWLLTSLVNVHVPRLKEHRPPFSRLMVLLSILSAWVLVPGTLLLFWVRYLPRHDWFWTAEQVVLLALSIALAVAFYWRARGTLRGDHAPEFAWRMVLKRAATLAHIGIFLFLTAFFAAVSLGAIEGIVGGGINANFRERDVSTKPSAWTGLGEADREKLDESLREKARAEFAQVKGAPLAGADLRGVDAWRAFLAKADLSHASLQGANFYEANLQGANLIGAKLQRADLRRAKLQDANLWAADLQSADLKEANLNRAHLRGTGLQGADLRDAKVQGAFLWLANLQGAKLQGANFQGANLSQTQLQGAFLAGASFQGADLGGANLERALFGESPWGATNLSGADLGTSEGLTQIQLDKACGDVKTKLPPGLTIKPCNKGKIGSK